MRTTIGLGIGRASVRALLLRDDKPTWMSARPYGDMAELSEAVHDLLSNVPKPKTRRASVIAALGPARAQVKRLSGMPAVRSRSMATEVVRANIGRFFLRNGVPLLLPELHRSEGAWWGATLEVPAILAVEEACRRVGVRLEGCVPTAAALAQLVSEGTITWRDGDAGIEIVGTRHAWTSITRVSPTATDVAPHPALTALSPDLMEFADAYAAARCSRRTPLLQRSAGRGANRILIRSVLGVAATLSLVAALLSPGIAASRQRDHDEPRLAAFRDSSAKWTTTIRELATITAALTELDRFAATRRSVTQLLGDVADALPDSSAIITLRVDSTGGSMTVLSTAAATVIPGLTTVEGIVDPRSSGAVTRESVNGPLQRIAVRFAAPRPRTQPPGPTR